MRRDADGTIRRAPETRPRRDILPPDISLLTWLGLLAAIFAAGMLRGFTGFGFALAAVPLASLALPPAQVVPAMVFMQVAIGARDWVKERRLADRFSVPRLVVGCALGTPLGVAVLAFLPGPIMRLVVGGVVLLAVFATWHGPGQPRPRQTWFALVCGLASGVFNGLSAMGGPPAVLYFLAVEPDRNITRSSLMFYFPLAAALALPGNFLAGLVHPSTLVMAAAGFPAMLAGCWIGGIAFRHVGGGSYRAVAALCLLTTAAAAIARGGAGLL